MKCSHIHSRGNATMHGAITLLFALASIIVASCEKKIFNPEYAQSAYGLGLTVRAEEAYYSYGEPVEFALKIVNLTDKTFTGHLADSQLYDIILFNRNGEPIWQYGYRYGFLPMGWSITLKSHQQRVFEEACEDTLEPGSYSAIGWFLFAPTLRDTTGFVVLAGSMK